MKQNFHFGPWLVEYTLEDGARLDRLCYEDYDLITTEIKSFRPPKADYGEYENRPVYGYDDCFPSVEPCPFPGLNWTVPDHGELCWLRWRVDVESDRLIFTTKSKVLPVAFVREMRFSNNCITWIFTVRNLGDEPLPFQHVMHPLMPLREIAGFELPLFDSVTDEINNRTLFLHDSAAVQEFLLNQAAGTANMLLLQKVENGKLSWTYRNGLRINVTFPVQLFPTIGIWWNNTGYPDEDGCRRNECALEPIPGFTSSLAEVYAEGKSLVAEPTKDFTWQIDWKITH